MQPMVIDLNEMFDEYDARAEAFFEKQPPRVETFDLDDPYTLMIQFSLLEGIWMELQYPSENDFYTCCEDVGNATFDVVDAAAMLEKWLAENGYQDRVEELTSWLATNWDLYLKSRQDHERTPKNVFASSEKRLQEELDNQLARVDRKPDFHYFHDMMNNLDELLGCRMRLLFGDGRDPPVNGDECFYFNGGTCMRYLDKFYGLDEKKCSFTSEGIEQRARCGAGDAWKNSPQWHG